MNNLDYIHLLTRFRHPPSPDHPLLLSAIACPFCEWRGSTLNDRSTHQLDTHELPLPASRTGTWTVTPRLTPFAPPNWRAASLEEWYGQEGQI